MSAMTASLGLYSHRSVVPLISHAFSALVLVCGHLLCKAVPPQCEPQRLYSLAFG